MTIAELAAKVAKTVRFTGRIEYDPSITASSSRRQAMNAHCHAVYQAHFSKKIMLDRWDAVIKSVMTSYGLLERQFEITNLKCEIDDPPQHFAGPYPPNGNFNTKGPANYS